MNVLIILKWLDNTEGDVDLLIFCMNIKTCLFDMYQEY